MENNISSSLLHVALKAEGKVFNESARKNPPRQVGVDEFKKACENFNNTSAEYVIFATPDDDMDKAEDLLKVPRGTLGTYHVQTLKEHEYCSSCNRKNNFLDVIATGIEDVHSAGFLKDALTGKYGYIVNDNTHQRCKCADCGNILPIKATKFLLPGTRSSIAGTSELSSGGGGSYYFHIPIVTVPF